MEITNKQRLTIITACVAAQTLHECLDDIQETSFYKHSLKHTTKKMQDELTRTCDPQINQLWNTSEESMLAIQEGILEISKIIADTDPVKIIAVGELLKRNPNALKLEEVYL